MYRLTFCHTRGIAIISEVTEKSNTIILCMYVLYFFYKKLFSFLTRLRSEIDDSKIHVSRSMHMHRQGL